MQAGAEARASITLAHKDKAVLKALAEGYMKTQNEDFARYVQKVSNKLGNFRPHNIIPASIADHADQDLSLMQCAFMLIDRARNLFTEVDIETRVVNKKVIYTFGRYKKYTGPFVEKIKKPERKLSAAIEDVLNKELSLEGMDYARFMMKVGVNALYAYYTAPHKPNYLGNEVERFKLFKLNPEKQVDIRTFVTLESCLKAAAMVKNKHKFEAVLLSPDLQTAVCEFGKRHFVLSVLKLYVQQQAHAWVQSDLLPHHPFANKILLEKMLAELPLSPQLLKANLTLEALNELYDHTHVRKKLDEALGKIQASSSSILNNEFVKQMAAIHQRVAEKSDSDLSLKVEQQLEQIYRCFSEWLRDDLIGQMHLYSKLKIIGKESDTEELVQKFTELSQLINEISQAEASELSVHIKGSVLHNVEAAESQCIESLKSVLDYFNFSIHDLETNKANNHYLSNVEEHKAIDVKLKQLQMGKDSIETLILMSTQFTRTEIEQLSHLLHTIKHSQSEEKWTECFKDLVATLKIEVVENKRSISEALAIGYVKQAKILLSHADRSSYQAKKQSRLQAKHIIEQGLIKHPNEARRIAESIVFFVKNNSRFRSLMMSARPSAYIMDFYGRSYYVTHTFYNLAKKINVALKHSKVKPNRKIEAIFRSPSITWWSRLGTFIKNFLTPAGLFWFISLRSEWQQSQALAAPTDSHSLESTDNDAEFKMNFSPKAAFSPKAQGEIGSLSPKARKPINVDDIELAPPLITPVPSAGIFFHRNTESANSLASAETIVLATSPYKF